MNAQTISPEIRDALRTARHVEFRLEAEYYALDWESRLELAAEVREIAAASEGRTRQLAEAVEFVLESELYDLSDWDERTDAAALTRVLVADLNRQEGGAR